MPRKAIGSNQLWVARTTGNGGYISIYLVTVYMATSVELMNAGVTSTRQVLGHAKQKSERAPNGCGVFLLP